MPGKVAYAKFLLKSKNRQAILRRFKKEMKQPSSSPVIKIFSPDGRPVFTLERIAGTS